MCNWLLSVFFKSIISSRHTTTHSVVLLHQLGRSLGSTAKQAPALHLTNHVILCPQYQSVWSWLNAVTVIWPLSAAMCCFSLWFTKDEKRWKLWKWSYCWDGESITLYYKSCWSFPIKYRSLITSCDINIRVT